MNAQVLTFPAATFIIVVVAITVAIVVSFKQLEVGLTKLITHGKPEVPGIAAAV